MTALAILERADEILADESKWTRGMCARDAGGLWVELSSPRACKWCLFGALERAARAFGLRTTPGSVFDAVYPHTGNRTLGEFNDATRTTFSDIKRVLAAAIGDLRSKQ